MLFTTSSSSHTTMFFQRIPRLGWPAARLLLGSVSALRAAWRAFFAFAALGCFAYFGLWGGMDSLLKADEEGNVRRKEEVPTDAVVQQLLEEIKVAKEKRQIAINAAMKILRALPKKDISYQNELARAEAAKALGDLRAGDSSYAVELLVDDIYSSYRRMLETKADGKPLAGMDAAQALVKIGLPVAKKMVESLGQEKSDRELLVYAKVFREMLGRYSVAAWIRQELDILEGPLPVLEPGVRVTQMRHIYELVKTPDYLNHPHPDQVRRDPDQDPAELPKE